MALALLYLVLALVAFVAATVVATLVMGKVQARRGGPKRSSADAATVSMLRRRRQRLDRRLGIDPDVEAGTRGHAGEDDDGEDPGAEQVANGDSTPRERPGGSAAP